MNSYASFCGVSLLIRRDVIVLLSVVHANVVINTPVSSYSTGKKKENLQKECPSYVSPVPQPSHSPRATPRDAARGVRVLRRAPGGARAILGGHAAVSAPAVDDDSSRLRIPGAFALQSRRLRPRRRRVRGGDRASARPARWVRRTRRAAARPHPRTHRRLQRAPRVRARTAGTPTSRLIC